MKIPKLPQFKGNLKHQIHAFEQKYKKSKQQLKSSQARIRRIQTIISDFQKLLGKEPPHVLTDKNSTKEQIKSFFIQHRITGLSEDLNEMERNLPTVMEHILSKSKLSSKDKKQLLKECIENLKKIEYQPFEKQVKAFATRYKTSLSTLSSSQDRIHRIQTLISDFSNLLNKKVEDQAITNPKITLQGLKKYFETKIPSLRHQPTDINFLERDLHLILQVLLDKSQLPKNEKEQLQKIIDDLKQTEENRSYTYRKKTPQKHTLRRTQSSPGRLQTQAKRAEQPSLFKNDLYLLPRFMQSAKIAENPLKILQDINRSELSANLILQDPKFLEIKKMAEELKNLSDQKKPSEIKKSRGRIRQKKEQLQKKIDNMENGLSRLEKSTNPDVKKAHAKMKHKIKLAKNELKKLDEAEKEVEKLPQRYDNLHKEFNTLIDQFLKYLEPTN